MVFVASSDEHKSAAKNVCSVTEIGTDSSRDEKRKANTILLCDIMNKLEELRCGSTDPDLRAAI